MRRRFSAMLKQPIKKRMYADFCHDIDENKIACLCKFHSRADIIGAKTNTSRQFPKI
jgi:hypothetical protein